MNMQAHSASKGSKGKIYLHRTLGEGLLETSLHLAAYETK